MKEDFTKRGGFSEASEPLSGSRNPPWFPSLMAFEHYDSARTHLFPDADFGWAFTGSNRVIARPSPTEYPTPYNVVYLGPDEVFVYGGGYGDVQGGTGAFVAKVDPDSLGTAWYNKLIDTVVTNEWDYPGALSALRDGYLYVIYSYRLAKINPQDGKRRRKTFGVAHTRGAAVRRLSGTARSSDERRLCVGVCRLGPQPYFRPGCWSGQGRCLGDTGQRFANSLGRTPDHH
jgi:hypothetical protein